MSDHTDGSSDWGNVPVEDRPDESTGASGAKNQRINVVDIICEGPIRGLKRGLQDVYLNDVAMILPGQAGYTPEGSILEPGSLETITFSGFTGTLLNNLPNYIVDGLYSDENRHLTLLNWRGPVEVSVSASEIDRGAGGLLGGEVDRYSVSAVGSASFVGFSPEWTAVSEYQNNVKVYPKIRRAGGDLKQGIQSLTPIGNNGQTADIVMTAPGLGWTPDVSGTYQLSVNKTFPVSDVTNNTITIANGSQDRAVPASEIEDGTYQYILSQVNQNGTPEDQATGIVPPKIESAHVEFREGTLDQLPTPEIGGVGGSTGIPGTPGSITNPILNQLDPTYSGGAPAGYVSLDTAGNPSGYTGYAANPTEISSGAFGLTTAAQIKSAAEISWTIKYPALQTTNLNSGAREKAYAFYTMEIAIERPGESTFEPYQQLWPENDYVVHFAKSNSPLEWEHTVQLDRFKPFTDLKVRIIRWSRNVGLPVGPDGTSGNRTDKTKWELQATSEIIRLGAVIKDKFSYPYTAHASVYFDSRQFQSTPKRSYLLEGLLVKIPSAYTPREYSDETDTSGNKKAKYAAFWDGSFREEKRYTDNPAWVFYDIVTNNRYGAGRWIQESDIDKYALYRISKYCDELVPDGNGGVEPRFRANLFLTKATNIYKVLKDMATIFNGILYWQNSQITPVQDAPSDPVYSFTKGNVIDGEFAYESTGSRTKTNQVVVTWNDPENNYQPVPVIVEDRESIARTGRIISSNAVAFGATSEGQAVRYGRWKLWTAQNQTEIISFKTALAGNYIRVGDVIDVQDADRFGVQYSGRVSPPNPEEGLSITALVAPGEMGSDTASGADGTQRSQDVVFAGELTLPSSFTSDAMIWEHGGTGVGSYLGVEERSGAYNLLFRASDGDSSVSATNTSNIFATVPISEIPQFDGREHTLIWEIQPDVGRLRLWIDRILYIDERTSDNSDLESGQWSGGDAGGWGSNASAEAGGESGAAWPVPPTTNLRVYNNQTVSGTYGTSNSSIVLDREVTLNVGSTYTLNTLVTKPAAFLGSSISATADGVTYTAGQRIPRAKVNGTIQGLSSEALASNAVDDSDEPLSLVWKPYTYLQKNTVENSSGTTSTLSANFAVAPAAQTIWSLTETQDGLTVNGSAKKYKVLSISQESDNEFAISAAEYYTEKYAAVDIDYNLGYIPTTIFPDRTEESAILPPRNLRMILDAGSRGAGETGTLEWDVPFDEAKQEATTTQVAVYEITHNIPGISSPIYTSTNSYEFKNLPNGVFTFNVRVVAKGGDVSDWIRLRNYEIEDPFEENCPRGPGGLPRGVVSSSRAGFSGSLLNNNFQFIFAESDVVLESVGDPRNAMTLIEASQSIAAITQDAEYYIIADSSESSLILAQWTTDVINNIPIWLDVGTGAAPSATSRIDIGFVNIAANSTTLSGSNLTSRLQVRDILSLNSNPVGTGVNGAVVTSVISDTKATIDRTFEDAISTSAYRIGYRPDTNQDAIVALIVNDGTDINLTRYITIDESLSTARAAFITVNPAVAQYSGSDDNITQINAQTFSVTVDTIGFSQPEFRITTTSGVDFTNQTSFCAANGADAFTYNIDMDSGTLAYDGNSTQTITASVRETAGTITFEKSAVAEITKLRDGVPGGTGSAGIDGKTVQLSSDQYVFTYDFGFLQETGTSRSATITATAFGVTEDTPYFQFYVDGSPSGGRTSTNTFTFDAPGTSSGPGTLRNIEVELSLCGDATLLATDTIDMIAVHEAIDAVTVVFPNQAHTVPVTTAGVVDYTGIGSTLEVYRGGTKLTPVTTNPGITTYRVSASAVGIAVGEDGFNIDGTNKIITIPDESLSSLTVDVATVEYTICTGTVNAFIEQTITKSKQGETGTGVDARVVSLSAQTYVVEFEQNGDISASTNISMSAEVLNTSGTVYYEFIVAGTSKQNTTSASFTYSSKNAIADMPETVIVKIREGASNSAVLASDAISIIGLQKGSDAYTIVAPNLAHVVPADNDGGNPNLNNSGTKIEVYRGATQLTYSSGTTVNYGFFSLSADITSGTVTFGNSGTGFGTDTFGSNGSKSAILVDYATFTTDLATVDIKVAVDGITTLVVTQTLSKSKQGSVGDTGTTVSLSSAILALAFDAAGNNPSPTSVVYEANVFNPPSGTLYYRFYVDNVGTIDSWSAGATSNTATIDTSGFSYSDMPKTVKVEVSTASDGSAIIASDSELLSGLKPGTDGNDAYSIIADNRNHTFTASKTGAVSDFTGSDTILRVFKGTTPLTYTNTDQAGEFKITEGSGVNVTPGGVDDLSTTTASIRELTAFQTAQDTGSVTYTISADGGVSLEFKRTFSKSKKGEDGTTTQGDNGLRYAEGYVYYQTKSSAAPAVPTNQEWVWATNSFSAIDSALTASSLESQGWARTPPNSPATNAEAGQFWISRWEAAQISSLSAATTITFEASSSVINYTDIVLFSDLENENDYTLIDGGNIKTDSITASSLKISANADSQTDSIYISASAIKIYDDSGLRVVIGKLTGTGITS